MQDNHIKAHKRTLTSNVVLIKNINNLRNNL